MKHYVIGCGGIGGWLVSCLARMLREDDELILMDGDKIEERNLDRQFFTEKDIGKYKARALARAVGGKHVKCKIVSVEEYLGATDTFEFEPQSVVFVCADNSRARVLSLKMCVEYGCNCIVSANEYETAESYYFDPEWDETSLDPRVFYEEMLDDESDDPLKPPCTGEAQEATPQLALANMLAASFAMRLYWFWKTKFPSFKTEEAKDMAPVHILSPASKILTKTIGDMKDVDTN